MAAQHPEGTVWPGLKLTAASGIQIVFGGNTPSRHPPGIPQRGIGIKVRGQNDSWNGLLDKKLHQMRFSHPDGELRIPVMGMPPRELTSDMIRRIREGYPLLGFLKEATICPARELLRDPRYRIYMYGDNIVMTLPQIPGDPQNYEFETAIPNADKPYDRKIPKKYKTAPYNNLYFIQLLPNELPSFHFWFNPETEVGFQDLEEWIDPAEGVYIRPENMDPEWRPLISPGFFIRQHVALPANGKPTDETRRIVAAESSASRLQTLRPRSTSPPQQQSTKTSPTGSPERKRKSPSPPASSSNKAAKTSKKTSPQGSPKRGRGKSPKTKGSDEDDDNGEFLPDEKELGEPQEVKRNRSKKGKDTKWAPPSVVDEEEDEEAMDWESRGAKGKGKAGGKGKRKGGIGKGKGKA